MAGGRNKAYHFFDKGMDLYAGNEPGGDVSFGTVGCPNMEPFVLSF
jgi:hypothetical protein